jgi:hypothetical protein
MASPTTTAYDCVPLLFLDITMLTIMRSFLTSFALFFVCSALSLWAQPGQLVPCFNTGTGFDGNTNSFILLPTGKLLCAGNFTTYNGSGAPGICRLNADGSLDPTFTPGIGANASIDCMAVLPNGQIIISGFFSSYNGTHSPSQC